MSDPELAARAQQAAERLERSWDRWRRLHGLTAEQMQPVSSYVGYSLAEPWGRPRVVFGFGAEEAELLATLLERDEGTDPRFSQGLLWEAGPHAQRGNGTVNGASFAEPPAHVAEHDRQQATATPIDSTVLDSTALDSVALDSVALDSVAPAGPARPSEPSSRAVPARDFEQPKRDLPQGVDSGLSGWTRAGSPPPARGA